MSLGHKNINRINDEYFCTHCGKSWDITDTEPPSCAPETYTISASRPAYTRRRSSPELQNIRGAVTCRVSCRAPNESGRPRTIPPMDYSDLEERALAHMVAGNNGFPYIPDSEDFGAYFVIFRDVATLIYASSMQECVAFYGKISKQMTGEKPKSPVLSIALTGMAFERATSLDRYCTGRTPRMEMNPTVMANASRSRTNKGNQYPVVNLIDFTKHIMAVIK